MALVEDQSYLAGTFDSATQSDYILVEGNARFELNFGSGTVALQESFDAVTWYTAKMPDGTTDASWTADVALSLFYPVQTYVRFNCSSYSSDITYKLRKG